MKLCKKEKNRMAVRRKRCIIFSTAGSTDTQEKKGFIDTKKNVSLIHKKKCFTDTKKRKCSTDTQEKKMFH